MTSNQHTTTLRIDEGLYRRAKAAAAAQGITLTRFIEDGLRLKLLEKPVASEIKLHTYDNGTPFNYTSEQLKQLLIDTDDGTELVDQQAGKQSREKQ